MEAWYHPSIAWMTPNRSAMLDETVPLARGSHRDVVSYSVEGANLLVRLRDGTSTGLARLAQFAGYRGEASAPSAVLLRNHELLQALPAAQTANLRRLAILRRVGGSAAHGSCQATPHPAAPPSAPKMISTLKK
jgi:hypothetical protein